MYHAHTHPCRCSHSSRPTRRSESETQYAVHRGMFANGSCCCSRPADADPGTGAVAQRAGIGGAPVAASHVAAPPPNDDDGGVEPSGGIGDDRAPLASRSRSSRRAARRAAELLPWPPPRAPPLAPPLPPKEVIGWRHDGGSRCGRSRAPASVASIGSER